MEPDDARIEELLARARATSEANATPTQEPSGPRREVVPRLLLQAFGLAVLLTLGVLLVLGLLGAVGAIW